MSLLALLRDIGFHGLMFPLQNVYNVNIHYRKAESLSRSCRTAWTSAHSELDAIECGSEGRPTFIKTTRTSHLFSITYWGPLHFPLAGQLRSRLHLPKFSQSYQQLSRNRQLLPQTGLYP